MPSSSGPLSRRTLLASAGFATAFLAGTPAGAAPAAPPVRPPAGTGPHALLLGVSGGPGWYPGTTPAGISTAVVVGDAVYLVDVGARALEQLFRANPTGTAPYQELSQLRGVFLTHLHSDHILDYNQLLVNAWWQGLQAMPKPLPVRGPGRRDTLPPVFGDGHEPPLVHPDNPGPGTEDMTASLIQAYATDINDRVRDNHFPDPRTLIDVRDIRVPGHRAEWEHARPMPKIDPFVVFEDDRVRVSATLVEHQPVYPAFAYRFDTDEGSLVVSGDTGVSENLVAMAAGADLLVHEVIDEQYVDAEHGDDEAVRNHLLTAHTPTNKVGQVAQAAGVPHLALNHLVPAQPPVSRWRNAKRGYDGRLTVGEDLMWLSFNRRGPTG